MFNKSSINRIMDLAYHIKALKDILIALIYGNWKAAAFQLVRHYWPVIVAIILIISLFPLIIFCSLPVAFLGFASDQSSDSLNTQALAVQGYYQRYEDFCKEREKEIRATAASQYDNLEIKISGEPMEKNWFIVLHSITYDNDLNKMTEKSVKELVFKSIVYSIKDNKKDTNESKTKSNILIISYLDPISFLSKYEYSEFDQNWAQLMYTTLSNESVFPDAGNSGGNMGSLFLNIDWRNHVTSKFGPRGGTFAGFHKGIDIAQPVGTQICAVKSGTVNAVDYGTTTYGYYVKIDHGGGMETLYAHCSKLFVTKGQKVNQGDVIALVGMTGRTNGPHCHFEVRINGKVTNPVPYLP